MARLTEAKILKLPEGVHGDDACHGLHVRVTAAGARSFYFRYKPKGGPRIQSTIGRCEDMSLEEAREEADKRRVARVPPKVATVKATLHVGDPYSASGPYLHKLSHKQRRPLYEDRDQRRYAQACVDAWGPRRPHTITRADVEKEATKLGKISANRFCAFVAAWWRWCQGERYIGADVASPTTNIRRAVEKPRTRILSPAECSTLVTAVHATEDADLIDLVHLALETGARSGMLLSLRWDDVDAAGWLTFREGTKKDTGELKVAVSADAIARIQARPRMLRTPWVFPSGKGEGHRGWPRKPWEAALTAAKLTDVVVHDLRRSASAAIVATHGLAAAAKHLQHSDSRVTEQHYHAIADEARRDIAEARAAELRKLLPAATRPKRQPRRARQPRGR